MRFLIPAASAALVTFSVLSTNAVLPTVGHRPAAVGLRRPAAANVSAVTERIVPSRADTIASRTGAVAQGRDFVWPLSPRPAVVRRFNPPQTKWSPGHRGVDLSASVGQPVLSAGEGAVTFSGMVAGRGVVVVSHAGGLRTTYDAVDERLTSGAVVRRGERIGVVSPAPGHCAPQTCLHWGAISSLAYRDPLSLLGFGQPILLPLG